MAKYNRIDEPVRMAKSFNEIAAGKERSENNTLKTFDKVRRNNQLYAEGYSLGINGGDLESATELVEENGKTIAKREHRNFKVGYKKGLEDLQAKLNMNKNEDTHRGR